MGHLVVVCFAQEWSPPALHTAQALEKLRKDGEPTSTPPLPPNHAYLPPFHVVSPLDFPATPGKVEVDSGSPRTLPRPLARPRPRTWLAPPGMRWYQV